jgi:alkylhydroperoxidase family enzyme
MSHRPEIAQQWSDLDEFIRFAGVLDPELKEEVRRALAQTGGCAFCSSLGTPRSNYDDDRIRAAVEFAIAVGRTPTGVADREWVQLRPHFSDPEIIELCTWVCFMYASEMFGALMQLEAAHPDVIAGYADYVRRGTLRYRRNALTQPMSSP